MSSGYAPKWFRFLVKYIPILFSQCKSGNYHYKYDKYCVCGDGGYPILPIYKKISGKWIKIGKLDMTSREDIQP